MLRGPGDDLADIVQSVSASHQSTGRLEAHIALTQMMIIRGDIRRVADNQAKTLTSQRIEPAALAKLGVDQLQALAIALGQPDRLGNAIHTDHLPASALAGQGQGNGTAAGAQVEYPL